MSPVKVVVAIAANGHRPTGCWRRCRQRVGSGGLKRYQESDSAIMGTPRCFGTGGRLGSAEAPTSVWMHHAHAASDGHDSHILVGVTDEPERLRRIWPLATSELIGRLRA